MTFLGGAVAVGCSLLAAASLVGKVRCTVVDSVLDSAHSQWWDGHCSYQLGLKFLVISLAFGVASPFCFALSVGYFICCAHPTLRPSRLHSLPPILSYLVPRIR